MLMFIVHIHCNGSAFTTSVIFIKVLNLTLENALR